MKKDNYDINVVKKPWGYEYLAYENENVALWFLHIKHTHSTSLHCHPKKTTGLVLLDGKAISAKKPSDITKLGIARTFQNIRLFNNLSVLDNIKIARHTRINYNFFDGIFKTKKYKI